MSSVPSAAGGKNGAERSLTGAGTPVAGPRTGPQAKRRVTMDVLSQEEIEAALAELSDWGFCEEALTRTFRFADFQAAVEFVERVAEVAEEHQHHPDIDIRFNKVTLRLHSHDAGGVTRRDVDLARALDRVA